jgi:flagellar motility protein MotE (MotC chaperone)
MELLYFISGVLSIGTVYAIVLLRKNQSNYHDALARLQSFQNICSIRKNEVSDELRDLNILIGDIQSSMEKDQYESLSELNKELGSIRKLANATNQKLGESNQVFNKNINDVVREIQQIKNNVKIMGQDPNVIDRF